MMLVFVPIFPNQFLIFSNLPGEILKSARPYDFVENAPSFFGRSTARPGVELLVGGGGFEDEEGFPINHESPEQGHYDQRAILQSMFFST